MPNEFSLFYQPRPPMQPVSSDPYRPAPNPTLAYAEQAAQPPPQFDPYEPMPTYQPGAQRPLGTLEALAAGGNRGVLGRIGAIRLAKRRQQEQQQEEAYKRQFYEWKMRRADAENRRKDEAERTKAEKKKYKSEWLKGADGKVHPHIYAEDEQPDYHPDDVPHKDYAPRDLDTQEEKLARIAAQAEASKDRAAMVQAAIGGRQQPPSQPSSVQEYEYARRNDGFTGSYQQFLVAKSEAGRRDTETPEERHERELASKWSEEALADKLRPELGGEFSPSPGAVSDRETEEIRRRLGQLRRGRGALEQPKGTAAPRSESSASPITHTTKDGKLGWNGREWVALRQAPTKQAAPKMYLDKKTGEMVTAEEAARRSRKFNSPADVKAAVKGGALSIDEAKRILKSQFGFGD